MHDTAMEFGSRFFNTYLKKPDGLHIVDIGAQDVNGSLRSVAPKTALYTGVDFEMGNGVDIVITDPYALPFDSDSVDVCVSSSCFEHSEFFWLTFLEVIRILKPNGLFYLNAPANGAFHRYPVDCWRFYPDSGMALQNWARRNGYTTTMLESFIGNQQAQMWNDFVAIFLKDECHASQHPDRMQYHFSTLTNGLTRGNAEYLNYDPCPQDQRMHFAYLSLMHSVSSKDNA